MVINVQCVEKACKELDVQYDFVDSNKNFLRVHINSKPYYFIQHANPFNTSMDRLISVDKGFTYDLMKSCIRMPLTKQYLYPYVEEKFAKYKNFNDIGGIVSDIQATFTFPVIVKKNRGSFGKNVFICKNQEEIETALKTIYENTKFFDYIALAQKKIAIQKEYRVVLFNHKIQFMYEKSTEKAKFDGNISPLHWDGGNAKLVVDSSLIDSMHSFIKPIFDTFDIMYAGLDVAIDTEGVYWLIEINSHPGFAYFIRDNGDDEVVKLYEKMLEHLMNTTK